MAVSARGLAKAADLLNGSFNLVITNVPYLGAGKQVEILKQFCEQNHKEAKADLATAFLERCLAFCQPDHGSTALVTPQNWLFLGSYKKLRQRLLQEVYWNSVARLGPKAFETIGGEVVNATLLTLTRRMPEAGHALTGIDVAAANTPELKAAALAQDAVTQVSQEGQLGNPDARVVIANLSETALLEEFATASLGLHVGDWESFRRNFWEMFGITKEWKTLHNSVACTSEYHGLEDVIFWPEDGKMHINNPSARVQGRPAWGQYGIAVSMMGELPVSLYHGGLFRNGVAIITPKRPNDLLPIWNFCSSPQFNEAVRAIDQKLYVTCSTLVKIAFDLEHWKKVAAEKYPNGLPKPYSSDPTQWLFNGHPKDSDSPLHVAVARLLGYQWPRQTGSSFPDCPALGPDGLESFVDNDGIVCLPSIHREQPAAYRLRQLLAAALGTYDEKALIQQASPKGSKSTNLEDWLRDEFFEQHCALFQHRPFIWHIWDGRKDGFHALVNYHKLDHAALKKLTFTYLGEWITIQENDVKADKPGAAERLGAAKTLQKQLEAILEGEAPLDIFVRWKPLGQQAIGWHPDLNDGVRLNIRPFLLAEDVGKKGAGILRFKPNIKWEKDRGKEPERPKTAYPWFWIDEEPEGVDPAPGPIFTGNRWNNIHLSREAKQTGKV
jgi:hypothetical protein